MSTYRKRPVVIEAMQFTGDNYAEVAHWAVMQGGTVTVESAACHGDGPPYWLVIETLEGRMICGRGDWMIRGVQGEFYPCKPDIFEATYEPVDGAA